MNQFKYRPVAGKCHKQSQPPSSTMLPITVFTVFIVGRAVVSASTVPLPDKEYYDLEDAEKLFEEHVKLHERNYDVEEYIKRFEIFQETLAKINDLNAKYPRTVFKVNHFADLTKEEKQGYLGFKAPSNETKYKERESYSHVESKTAAPEAFDWRDHGAVTPVKNQGRCGSCYIFSAIGNIEGQYAIKHKQLVALSEQQCLDCLPGMTCGGGFMVDVMQKLSNTKGSIKEEDYPYSGTKGQCQEKANILAKVTGGKVLNIADAEDLKQKLHDIGPLSVALDASDFFNYHGGVLHPAGCRESPINHAVTLVGYGEDKGDKYWILKNSWGQYGENGYVRLLRGVNACGIEKSGIISTATVE